MKPLLDVRTIVVHGTDTPPTMSVTKELLWKWHVIENRWDDIGYHHLIKRSGEMIACRPESYQAAHAVGLNDVSLAVALEGGWKGNNDYTDAQFKKLREFIDDVRSLKPTIGVMGHNNADLKPCPGFDVQHWYYREV